MKLNINLKNNGGLRFRENKISINFTEGDLIKFGSDGGLYVANLKGSDGSYKGSTCDNWTIFEKTNGGEKFPTTSNAPTYQVPTQNGGVYLDDRAVQYVYCIGAYKIKDNDHWIKKSDLANFKSFPCSADLKDGKSVVDEFNWAQEHMGLPVTPFYIKSGDLLMLKDIASPYRGIVADYEDMDSSSSVYENIFKNNGTYVQTWENMERQPVTKNSNASLLGTKILAMFVIDEALYTPKSPRLRSRDSLILVRFKATCLWSRLDSCPVGMYMYYDSGAAIPEPGVPYTPDDNPNILPPSKNGWEDVTPPDTIDPAGDEFKDGSGNGSNIRDHVKTSTTPYETTYHPEVYLSGAYGLVWLKDYKEWWDHGTTLRPITIQNVVKDANGNITSFGVNPAWRPMDGSSAVNTFDGNQLLYSTYNESGDNVGYNGTTFELVEYIERIKDLDGSYTTESKYVLSPTGVDINDPEDLLRYNYGYTYGSSIMSIEDSIKVYAMNSDFLSAYGNLTAIIDKREQELADLIKQALTEASANNFSVNGGSGGATGSCSTIIEAIVTVVCATQHTGGFVTYCMGGARTLQVNGKELHGRIDCTGLMMFVLGLMGYKISNVQSTTMCNTKEKAIMYADGSAACSDGTDKDFQMIHNPTASDLAPGDLVCRRGHGEIFGVYLNGRKYGWNWGDTNPIARTYDACVEAQSHMGQSDFASAAVDALVAHNQTLSSQGYEIAFRFLGKKGTAEQYYN